MHYITDYVNTDYVVNDIPIIDNAIIDYVVNDIPNSINYILYNNWTNINNYIVNNFNYNIIYDEPEPTLSALQYFSIMCFLDEIS
jgi:hypothetical protein